LNILAVKKKVKIKILDLSNHTKNPKHNDKHNSRLNQRNLPNAASKRQVRKA
jgi:hypothetical protein